MGPVTNKSGTDEETAFFLSVLEQFVYVLLGNGALSRVLAFRVGRQVALLQSPDPKLGAEIRVGELLLHHSDQAGSSRGLLRKWEPMWLGLSSMK